MITSGPRWSLIAFDSSTVCASRRVPQSNGSSAPRSAASISGLPGGDGRRDRRPARRAPSGCRRRPAAPGSAAGAHQPAQMEEDDLGAVDRERGNDDRPAALRRAAQRLLEELHRARVVVSAIAVGRLDDDDVRRRRRGRRAQQRMARPPEVAAERERARASGRRARRWPRRGCGRRGERSRARRRPPRPRRRTARRRTARAPARRRPPCRAAAPECASSSPRGWRRRRPLPAGGRCPAGRCGTAPACPAWRRCGRETRRTRAGR